MAGKENAVESTWWFHVCGDNENIQIDVRLPRRWLLVLAVVTLITWAPNLWTAIQTALNAVR